MANSPFPRPDGLSSRVYYQTTLAIFLKQVRLRWCAVCCLVGVSVSTMAGRVCRNGGEDCVKVREGKTRILFPRGNWVFYNPVQELNRDLRCDHVMCVLCSLNQLGSFGTQHCCYQALHTPVLDHQQRTKEERYNNEIFGDQVRACMISSCQG